MLVHFQEDNFQVDWTLRTIYFDDVSLRRGESGCHGYVATGTAVPESDWADQEDSEVC